jgi:hypothetical protein
MEAIPRRRPVVGCLLHDLFGVVDHEEHSARGAIRSRAGSVLKSGDVGAIQ